MRDTTGRLRDLQQEIYVQDLVLSIYGIYASRIRDDGARSILARYLRAEEDRRGRVAAYLSRRGRSTSAALRRAFALAGRIYGRITSPLGTRIMLRIILSASRSASRRACALADGAAAGGTPELQYLAGLGARNESDLLGELRQHLIDTRPRRA